VSGSGAHYNISLSVAVPPGDFTLTIDGSLVQSVDGSQLGDDFVLHFSTVDLTPLSVRIPEKASVNPENCINSNNETAVTVEVQLPSTVKGTDTVCIVFGAYEVTATAPAIDGGGLLVLGNIDCSSLSDGSVSLGAFVLRNGWISEPASQLVLKDTTPMDLQIKNPASMPSLGGDLYHQLIRIYFEGDVSEDGDVIVDFDGVETPYSVTVATGFAVEYTIPDVARAHPVIIKTRDGAWNTQIVYEFDLWRLGGQSGTEITSSGSLTVHIYDSDTLQPVDRAYVIVGDHIREGYTDPDGLFVCSVSSSPTAVTVVKEKYHITTFVEVTRDHLSLPLTPQDKQQPAIVEVDTQGVSVSPGYGHCNHMEGLLNDTDPSDAQCSFKITARRQYSVSVFGNWGGGVTGIQYLLHNKPLDPSTSASHSLPALAVASPSYTINAASTLTLPNGVYLPQCQQPVWRGEVAVSVLLKNETKRLFVGRANLNDALSKDTGNYLASDLAYFEIPEALDYSLNINAVDIFGRLFSYRHIDSTPFSGRIDFPDPLEPPEVITPCKGEVVSDIYNFTISWKNTLLLKAAEGYYIVEMKNIANGAKWFVFTPAAVDTVTPIRVPGWYSTPVLNYGDDVSVRVFGFEVSTGSWANFSLVDAGLNYSRGASSTERRFHLFDPDTSPYLPFVGVAGRALPGTLTVRIINMATGAPESGVYVYLDNDTANGVSTDANGVATLYATSPSVAVTAVKSGYSYITVFGVKRNFVTLPIAQPPDPTQIFVLYGEVSINTADNGFATGRSVFDNYYPFFNINDPSSSGLTDPLGRTPFSATPDNFSFAVPLNDTDVILSVFDTDPALPSRTIRAGEVLRQTVTPEWDDVNLCWYWNFSSTITLRGGLAVFAPMSAATRPGSITAPKDADGAFVNPLAIVGDLFFGKGKVQIGVGSVSGSGTSFDFGFSHILPGAAFGDYDCLALQMGADGTNLDGSFWDCDHILGPLKSFPSEYDAKLKEPPSITYPSHGSSLDWSDRRIQWDHSEDFQTAFFNIMLAEGSGQWFWQVVVMPQNSPQTVILPPLPAGYRGPQNGDSIKLEVTQMSLSPFSDSQWSIKNIFDIWEGEAEHSISFTYSSP